MNWRPLVAGRVDIELETVIRQLTATYGGRLEPYAEVGFEGFMLVVSETRARLLSSDPRVAVVEEMPRAAALPPAAGDASDR